LHWLSESYVNGIRITGEDDSPAFVKARVQATRDLWDPDFIAESWISGLNGGQPIELLTWLKDAIDLRYPDTKLALSEWTYGGGKSISGAIAAADALGIFGQRSVDLAGAVSQSPDQEPYLIGAFQAYRNYDGQGHGFGDTSVFASSSDVALGTIYASVDASDPSRMVLVAINRHDYELDATLNIAHTASYTSLTPYTISDGHPEPVAGDMITTDTANSFQMTLAPYSVWVLVPNE
jgi:mannan endo-1,4-beta-mannosidase